MVAGIIAFVSTIILVNFPRTRVDLSQGANQIISDLRIAQTYAVSSEHYNNYVPCGYGFHYVDSTHFAIYVGPDASTTDCSSINKNYQSGEDIIIRTDAFQNTQIRFVTSFSDIFFVPPDPKTYLNNNPLLNQAPIAITISKVNGGSCNVSDNCKNINVYSSGKIEAQ